MPYVLDPNLEQDENQTGNNPTQVQISGASPTTDSSGNMISSSPGSTNAGDTQKQLVTGSGYENLDKYLNTNNAKQFGTQFYGNVQGDIDSAKQKQSNASGQFESQVKSASQTPTSDQVNSSIANPTSADAKQFQGWENQTYQGPHNLAESPDLYNQYWSGTSKANTDANLAGTEPGRFSLLDSYYGRPNYSYGQKSLDNLLVQQSGLGSTQKGLQTQAAQLTGAGNSQSNELTNDASKAAGQVEQSRNYTQNAIGVDPTGQVVTDPAASGYGAIGQQYSTVNNALTAANEDRKNQIAAAKLGLTSGHLNPDQLAATGLTSGENIYNLDLSHYLTPGIDLNVNQTMTPEQQSYIQALSKLAGVTDTFASGTPQAATPAYTFNQDQFTTDQQAAQAAYNRQISQSQAELAGLNGSPMSLVAGHYSSATPADLAFQNGIPSNNASADDLYNFYQNYLNQQKAGNLNFQLNHQDQLKQALAEYENAHNTYNPDRRIS